MALMFVEFFCYRFGQVANDKQAPYALGIFRGLFVQKITLTDDN